MPRPPEPDNAGPIHVVLNRGSGRRRADDVRDAIEAACRAAGRPVSIETIGRGAAHSPDACARRATERANRDDGIIVAAGGDGTINAVANVVYRSGRALGVLPQGTFNYFSRAHGIPTTLDGSLQALLTGRPAPVQVGLVNDHVFVVNASLGLYARLLEDREQIKARFGRRRWIALLAAAVTMLRGARRWQLDISGDGPARSLRTPTLFVGNNALQLEQVGLPESSAVENGRLAALHLRSAGRWTMVGLLGAAALGRLGDADAVEHFAFRTMRVSVRRRPGRRVKVAADGELLSLPMPLAFCVGDEPLWLIKPKP